MNRMLTNGKPINRRTFLKKTGKIYLGLIAAGMISGTYSYKIERFWYQIKEIQLKVRNLPSAFAGWKIVQFSDIHLGFHYGIEDFKHVVKMINSLNPDIIFFTGDLIQIGNIEPELSIPLLQELKGLRGGKWAVIGDHDFYTKDQIKNVLEKAQFKVLSNRHDFIESNQQRL